MGRTKVKSRGQRFRRALMLPGRYGLRSWRFMRNLTGMVALLKSHSVVGTFPVTAIVLERHPDLVGALDGMEIALHGLRHRDFSHLDVGIQASMMRDALDRLRSQGIEVVGFRAPYLRWSESTLDAVATAGMIYDSSIPVGWDCGTDLDSRAETRSAFEAYGIDSSGTRSPSMRGRLVEMTVAIPDDELLFDRLRVTAHERLSRALTSMMNSAILSSDHLVLQLHPERFHFFERALNDVLSLAIGRKVWIAPLRDVAKWWLKRSPENPKWPDGAPCALTISGDIDAVTILDFISRQMGR